VPPDPPAAPPAVQTTAPAAQATAQEAAPVPGSHGYVPTVPFSAPQQPVPTQHKRSRPRGRRGGRRVQARRSSQTHVASQPHVPRQQSHPRMKQQHSSVQCQRSMSAQPTAIAAVQAIAQEAMRSVVAMHAAGQPPKRRRRQDVSAPSPDAQPNAAWVTGKSRGARMS
jgi:hypothetical protein